MLLTVYLDTNIIIDGEKREEHLRLKELAIKGHIQLFIGPEVSREIWDKISVLRDDKQKLMENDIKYSPLESIEKRRAIDEQIKAWEKRLSRELEFWKDAKPIRPNNTFEGLAFTIMALGLPAAIAIDTKNEIALVLALQRDYNIRVTDAFHLMQAHSANINYFLSWDYKGFIKKAKRVFWLIPKVMTPKDFLIEHEDLIKPGK